MHPLLAVARDTLGVATGAPPLWLSYANTYATVFLAFLTAINVGLVWRYTVATSRMVQEMKATRQSQADAVEEMRHTREAEVRPVLVPHAALREPGQPLVHFGVKNVGRGPALSVDVIIRWTELQRFRLRCPVLEPGEVRIVKYSGWPSGVTQDPALIPEAERTLRLTGKCLDVGGATHPVDTRAPFFDHWEDNISEELTAQLDAEWRALSKRGPGPVE